MGAMLLNRDVLKDRDYLSLTAGDYKGISVFEKYIGFPKDSV